MICFYFCASFYYSFSSLYFSKSIPNDKFLSSLAKSESFGESALISGKLRTNNAVADTDTQLIEVSTEILDEKISVESPLVKLTLLSVLRRLELMNKLRMPNDFNS